MGPFGRIFFLFLPLGQPRFFTGCRTQQTHWKGAPGGRGQTHRRQCWSLGGHGRSLMGYGHSIWAGNQVGGTMSEKGPGGPRAITYIGIRIACDREEDRWGYPAAEGFRGPGKGMQPPGTDNIAQWEWLLLWGSCYARAEMSLGTAGWEAGQLARAGTRPEVGWHLSRGGASDSTQEGKIWTTGGSPRGQILLGRHFKTGLGGRERPEGRDGGGCVCVCLFSPLLRGVPSRRRHAGPHHVLA